MLQVKVYNCYPAGYVRSTEPKHNELPRRKGTEFKELECDTVVLVTGRVPNDALYRELRERQSEWEKEGIRGVYQAGDCFAPRITADVVFDGHRIARELEADNPQRQRPYIRERMIWGSRTYPEIGAGLSP